MNAHHVAHYIIGLAALALASFGGHGLSDRIVALEHRPVPAITGQIGGPWGLLSQSEVSAISLAVSSKPQAVKIYCKADCSGLALDLDNAFESAHWRSEIEQPVIDTNVGINTTSRWLTDALNSATGGRFDIGVIEGDHLSVIISKRGK